jgi:hypothetical protein
VGSAQARELHALHPVPRLAFRQEPQLLQLIVRGLDVGQVPVVCRCHGNDIHPLELRHANLCGCAVRELAGLECLPDRCPRLVGSVQRDPRHPLTARAAALQRYRVHAALRRLELLVLPSGLDQYLPHSGRERCAPPPQPTTRTYCQSTRERGEGGGSSLEGHATCSCNSPWSRGGCDTLIRIQLTV